MSLLLLALLQIGDWLTTRTILNRGGRELNPIVRFLIEKLGLDLALLLKGTLVLVIAWLTGPLVAWFGVALYVLVVGWNLTQL
jgi:hypothetical protein